MLPASHNVSDAYLRTATHLFKVLVLAVKQAIAPRGVQQARPSNGLIALVDAVNRDLTPKLYECVRLKELDMRDDDRSATAKHKREERLIPNLIFAIEEFERFLIQLTKVSNTNMLRNAKRTTSRDFKITDDRQKRPAPEEEDDDDEEEPEPEHEDEEMGGGDEGYAPEEEEW